MPGPTYLESIGNTGYVAFGPEVAIGTPVIPADMGFMDNETMQTMANFEEQTPITGQLMDNYQTLPGLRTHGGDVSIVAEPNTALYLTDMLLARGTVSPIYLFTVTSANATIGATYTNNGQTFTVLGTIASSTTLIASGTGAPTSTGTLTKAGGTGDATITYSAQSKISNMWPFTLANPSKSYTIDIPVGQGLVKRFWGCMAESLSPSWNKNQLYLKASISALGSFQGRQVASVAGSGPYTVTLDTSYSQSPTTGLVVGDLIAFYDSTNAIVNATVASVVNGTQFTTATNVSAFVSGDFVYLRQQTLTNNMLSPFLWSNASFCFGATAAAALVATPTPIEQGANWNISWPFENKGGSARSGSPDPSSLVRLTAQPTLELKKFFGSPQDIQNFNQLNKTACVIRLYAYVGTTVYEMRITFNHLTTDSPMPQVGARKVNYSAMKFIPQYDVTDGQGFDIKLINGLATIT